MDIFKILGFCLCALVLLSVLRQYNPGYAVLAALACCMVLLWFVMQALGPVLSFVETLSQFSGFEHFDIAFIPREISATSCSRGRFGSLPRKS